MCGSAMPHLHVGSTVGRLRADYTHTMQTLNPRANNPSTLKALLPHLHGGGRVGRLMAGHRQTLQTLNTRAAKAGWGVCEQATRTQCKP
jgi:hypothetical protein